MSSQTADLLIIGAGPAGAAAAIRAARQGATRRRLRQGSLRTRQGVRRRTHPRAVGALNELEIALDGAHHIVGLRMIANNTVRELDWPDGTAFPEPRRGVAATSPRCGAHRRCVGGRCRRPVGDRSASGDGTTTGSSVSRPAGHLASSDDDRRDGRAREGRQDARAPSESPTSRSVWRSAPTPSHHGTTTHTSKRV